MTREDKDLLVEMLAKIPVTETKGSLLSAIGKLLRVIDISENSIMIPTLLKDKCEFDAYEMLTLAKILKASILGHNDLVEFYMSESSSQSNPSLLAYHQQQQSLSVTSQSNASSRRGSSNNNNIISHSQHANGRQHLNHLSPIHQQSATPSLRSSVSETTSSSQPSTPIQTHSESLGGSGHHPAWPVMSSSGDPDATVRLLVHIEQLKIFIPQVTGIFESIIELYKNSVDTITYKSHSRN